MQIKYMLALWVRTENSYMCGVREQHPWHSSYVLVSSYYTCVHAQAYRHTSLQSLTGVLWLHYTCELGIPMYICNVASKH